LPRLRLGGMTGPLCAEGRFFLDKFIRLASICFCGIYFISKKPMFVGLRSLPLFCAMLDGIKTRRPVLK
jgi:hypothetical protein